MIKESAPLSLVEVSNILDELKINPSVRPQELTIEEWINLYNKVVK